MAHTLTIEKNDEKIVVNRDETIYLIFKDENGKTIEFSILGINDLEPLMIARTNEIFSRPTHEYPPETGNTSEK